MKVEEAWTILQDSSEEDPKWQEAAQVLHDFVFHGEEFEKARRVVQRSDGSIDGTFFDALIDVMLMALDRFKEPYEGPKGEDAVKDTEEKESGSKPRSIPGLFGAYMHAPTREQIAGRLGTRANGLRRSRRAGDKKAVPLLSPKVDSEAPRGLHAQQEAQNRNTSELNFASALKMRQHAMRNDVVNAFDTQGAHYIGDLKSPEGKKTQQRTIQRAELMVQGDRSLLAEQADYPDVLVLHGADLDDHNSVERAQQAISRARTRFLGWSRDVPTLITLKVYSDDYEDHTLTASQFLEGVYAWLTSQRTFRTP